MGTFTPDWPTIKSLLEDLTGLPTINHSPGALNDPMQPRPFTNPVTKAQLSVLIHHTQMLGGMDDFILTYDGTADQNNTTQEGNRLFVMTVKLESFNPASNAYEILETLRSKLFRASSLARLRAQGMTATTADPVVNLPTTYDEHVYSVAAMDVHMAQRFSTADDTEETNYIETYDMTYDP